MYWQTTATLMVFGLLGLWISSGMIISAAQKIAKALRLSEVFIGLTVISIGTSLPEIITHIVASIDILKGIETSDIAIGTNIGSNIVQITLIIGILGMITNVKANKKVMNRDYLVMLGSIVLLFIFGLNGYISKIEGLILIILYVVYLISLLKGEKIVIDDKKGKNQFLLDSFWIVLGFGILVYSADLLLDNAIELTKIFNITGSFIGTVIIGLITVLPELTTTLRAILKKSHGISLGTLIGSNITNPLLALGIGAMISGYQMASSILWFDIPFWFAVSILGFVFFTRDSVLDRKEGMTLIGAYILYLTIKLVFFF